MDVSIILKQRIKQKKVEHCSFIIIVIQRILTVVHGDLKPFLTTSVYYNILT